MSVRWTPGLWIGKAQSSDEHIIWDLTGRDARCARSIRVLEDVTLEEHLRAVTSRPLSQDTGLRLRPLQETTPGG